MSEQMYLVMNYHGTRGIDLDRRLMGTGYMVVKEVPLEARVLTREEVEESLKYFMLEEFLNTPDLTVKKCLDELFGNDIDPKQSI